MKINITEDLLSKLSPNLREELLNAGVSRIQLSPNAYCSDSTILVYCSHRAFDAIWNQAKSEGLSVEPKFEE